jgi:hypothetical protein
MKLLTEYNIFEYTPDMIKESIEKNEGKIVMRGVLQKANTLNQNGRVYPLPILQREIMNYQKFIREGRSMGELDHPDSSVVELKNVSHIVRDAQMDGDVVIGTVEVLSTPSGRILQSLIESGIKLGISSRGVGTTKRQGDTQVVQDDFQLICWDFVSEPSTPGAFMVAEGRDLSDDELKNIFTKTDRIDRILNDIIGDE